MEEGAVKETWAPSHWHNNTYETAFSHTQTMVPIFITKAEQGRKPTQTRLPPKHLTPEVQLLSQKRWCPGEFITYQHVMTFYRGKSEGNSWTQHSTARKKKNQRTIYSDLKILLSTLTDTKYEPNLWVNKQIWLCTWYILKKKKNNPNKTITAHVRTKKEKNQQFDTYLPYLIWISTALRVWAN